MEGRAVAQEEEEEEKEEEKEERGSLLALVARETYGESRSALAAATRGTTCSRHHRACLSRRCHLDGSPPTRPPPSS